MTQENLVTQISTLNSLTAASPHRRNINLASETQDVDALSANSLHRERETNGPALVIIHVVETQRMLHFIRCEPIVSHMGHDELHTIVEVGRGVNQDVFFNQLQR